METCFKILYSEASNIYTWHPYFLEYSSNQIYLFDTDLKSKMVTSIGLVLKWVIMGGNV